MSTYGNSLNKTKKKIWLHSLLEIITVNRKCHIEFIFFYFNKGACVKLKYYEQLTIVHNITTSE